MEQTDFLLTPPSPGSSKPLPGATGAGAAHGTLTARGSGEGLAEAPGMTAKPALAGSTDKDSLAVFAGQEFRRRQQFARELVGKGEMNLAEAETRIRAWLAIACRAGADLPELEEGLAARRTKYPSGRMRFTEGEIRATAADTIAPPRRWQAELAQARDAALARVPADHAEAARQRGIHDLARLLIPHIPFRPPAAEGIGSTNVRASRSMPGAGRTPDKSSLVALSNGDNQ